MNPAAAARSPAPLSARSPARSSPWAPGAGAVLGLGVGLATVAAVTGLAAAGAPAPIPTGLSEPGPVVRWGLPGARVVQHLAAAVAVGLLALRALAIPTTTRADPTRLSRPEQVALRWAGAAGLVWASALAVVYLLSYAELLGRPASDPAVWAGLPDFAATVLLGRVLAESVVLAALAALAALVARGPTLAAAATLIAGLALVLPAYASHSSTSSGHDTAVLALALHLGAVAIWAGGLVGLVVLRPVLGVHLGATVRAYSTLAGLAYALVALTGVVNALLRLPSTATATATATATGAADQGVIHAAPGWALPALDQASGTYLMILAVKVAAFTALGVAGWAQRRRLLPLLIDDASLPPTPASSPPHPPGPPGPTAQAPGAWFARLAAGEVAVIAVAIGLSVVLARIPATG